MNFFSKTFAIAAISVAAIASPASAGEAGPYVTANVGTGFNTETTGEVSGIDIEADSRTTFMGGVGFGYDTGSNLRTEVGVSYGTADVDNVRVAGRNYDVDESGDGWSVGTRIFYDFANDSDFTPFVGTGVELNWSDSSVVYAIPVVAGVSYEATESVDVFGQLTYAMAPAQDVSGVDYDFNSAFSVQMGIRFSL
tara:strand:- start:256 stop:840 length:585 start_codon:yes stop_codon:yes gene_type:complete